MTGLVVEILTCPEESGSSSQCWTYFRFGEGVKGFSGLLGGRLPGLPFPGGGAGFLGGTSGAAGFVALWSTDMGNP